jgi:N-acyl-D-amino-acid deacylase
MHGWARFPMVVCGAIASLAMNLSAQQAVDSRSFDVVILHGHILDGTGSPWYSGDVGIRNGHIAAIGDLGSAPAKQKIDAQGRSWHRDLSTCWGSRS